MLRTVVIGGPRTGKSTYASSLYVPHFCGDPKSLVKEPLPNVNYLPEHLNWSEGSDYIASNWFTKKGEWVIEGVSVVRALRKWRHMNQAMPCDKIVYFVNNHPSVQMLPGQESMGKGVKSIWLEIASYYSAITVYREWR